MTDFVFDDTDLWEDKVEVNPVTVAGQQWGAADAALAKGALLSLRSAILGGAVMDARQFGVVVGGASDSSSLTRNTTAMQAAINAAQGRPLYLPRGLYAFNSGALVNTARSLCIVGDYGNRAANNGTELTFYGAGIAIQNGTDNGHAWDANEYDGPQDARFENLWISHAAPDTTSASAANYKLGGYGIWDWRGGQLVLRNVGIEHFEANFVGIQSDIDLFDYVVSLYSKWGLYVGPRSDQFTCRNLYSFSCDRAVTIDSPACARFIDCQIVGCGTDTVSAVEIRRNSSAIRFERCWFEHLQNYSGTDQISFVSVGEVAGYGGTGGSDGGIASPGSTPNHTTIQGVSITHPFVYSTNVGLSFHTKYLASVGKCQFFKVDHPLSHTGSAFTNFDALVAVTQNVSTNDTQVEIRGVPSSFALSKIYQNIGGGSPVASVLATGQSGTTLVDSFTLTGNQTVTGTITVTGPAAGLAIVGFNSNTGQTASSSPVVKGRQDGTFNTTSGTLQAVGMIAEAVATRSAGANNLQNVALRCNATGAQVSTAIEAQNGDVILNLNSGLTKAVRSVYYTSEIVPA